MRADQILPWYYGANFLFLLLDYLVGLNVRLAFIDGLPLAKPGYYGVCFVCFALML